MEVFVGMITAVLAIGTIAENDKSKTKTLAVCFCLSMAVLAILSIA